MDAEIAALLKVLALVWILAISAYLYPMCRSHLTKKRVTIPKATAARIEEELRTLVTLTPELRRAPTLWKIETVDDLVDDLHVLVGDLAEARSHYPLTWLKLSQSNPKGA